MEEFIRAKEVDYELGNEANIKEHLIGFVLSVRMDQGNLEKIKLIFKYACYSDKELALRKAAEHGYFTIVKFFVKKHVNFHVNAEEALRYAVGNGHLKIVQFFLEKGTNMYASDNAPLRWSAIQGHIKIVKVFLKKSANIHVNNMYILRLTAIMRKLNVMKLFGRKGFTEKKYIK